MFYPATYPLRRVTFPNFSQRLRNWLTALLPAPATQIQIQPGDAYHLDAGRYRLQVVAGSVWAPTAGILDAGDQVTLTVDAGGLALQSYAQQPVVVALRSA